MLASEIISRIKLAIGQSSDDDRFSATDLLNIVNEGYVDFCRYTEALETITTSTMTALSSVVTLPSNFLEARQFRWSYNRPLYPMSRRKLDYDEQTWTNVVGTPEAIVYQNWGAVRTKPITLSAGTVTMKYAYIPSDLTTSDTPSLMSVFHEALIDFGASECFYAMRDASNGKLKWDSYLERREKGKVQSRQFQRTPDVFLSQRPITTFNLPYWDNRFRSRS